MSEENKENKTEDINSSKETDASISAEELAKIEKEVLSKDQAKNASIIKETEDRVKKELLEKQEFENLKAEKEKLEEAVKAQVIEKKRYEEEMAEKMKALKAEQGESKALVNNQSPFNEINKRLSDEEILQKAAEMSDETVMSIDSKSRDAFLKEHGLTSSQFGGK